MFDRTLQRCNVPFPYLIGGTMSYARSRMTLADAYATVPPRSVIGNELHYEAIRRITERYAVARVNGLPMMTDRCAVCGRQVDFDDMSVHLSRINGDSRWGFEPYHTTMDCVRPS
jgi:hypothetical protein